MHRLASAFILAFCRIPEDQLAIKSWDEYKYGDEVRGREGERETKRRRDEEIRSEE